MKFLWCAFGNFLPGQSQDGTARTRPWKIFGGPFPPSPTRVMQRETGFDKMADRVGSEPTVSLHPRRVSSLPESLFADVSACFHRSLSSAPAVAWPSRLQTPFKRDPRHEPK